MSRKMKTLILLALAIPMMIIAFGITAWIQFTNDSSTTEVEAKNEVIDDSAPADPSPAPDEKPKKTPVAAMTQEEKQSSKIVAEKFAQAYGNYDSENPLLFIQNAKPYMTEGFYSQWTEEPPRKPLALVKSTIIKKETFPVDGGDQYAIAWNVVLTENAVNTLGDKVQQEEWLWILVEKENGQWKVKDVNVTNG